MQCDKISQLDDLLAEFENQHHIGRLAIIRAWTGHKRAIKTVLQQVVLNMQLVSSHVQLAFQLSVFIHGLVSLNFACQLAVVQVLLLEQLSLPVHQLVSSANR